jgi:hypothetical protein
MRRPIPAFLLALLVPASALAVPGFVTYSGRLTDGTAWGASATVNLTVRLYSCECDAGGECGAPCALGQDGLVFTGFHGNTKVVDGYFAVNIGTCDRDGACPAKPEMALPALLPDALWLTVSVNGAPYLLPRQPIGSVPYALQAQAAQQAAAADVAGAAGGQLATELEIREAGAMCAAARAGMARSQQTFDEALAVPYLQSQSGNSVCAAQALKKQCYAVVQSDAGGMYTSVGCDHVGHATQTHYACCDDFAPDSALRTTSSIGAAVPAGSFLFGVRAYCPLSHPIPVVGGCHSQSGNLTLVQSEPLNWATPSTWSSTTETSRAGWDCSARNAHATNAYTMTSRIVCASGK